MSTDYRNNVFEIAPDTIIILKISFWNQKHLFIKQLLDKIHSHTLVLHCGIKS